MGPGAAQGLAPRSAARYAAIPRARREEQPPCSAGEGEGVEPPSPAPSSIALAARRGLERAALSLLSTASRRGCFPSPLAP